METAMYEKAWEKGIGTKRAEILEDKTYNTPYGQVRALKLSKRYWILVTERKSGDTVRYDIEVKDDHRMPGDETILEVSAIQATKDKRINYCRRWVYARERLGYRPTKADHIGVVTLDGEDYLEMYREQESSQVWHINDDDKRHYYHVDGWSKDDVLNQLANHLTMSVIDNKD